MPKELTWRNAIEKVLSEAPGAVHYRDLTDRIIEEGLCTSLGATPAATVSAYLTTGAVLLGSFGHRSSARAVATKVIEAHRTKIPAAVRMVLRTANRRPVISIPFIVMIMYGDAVTRDPG